MYDFMNEHNQGRLLQRTIKFNSIISSLQFHIDGCLNMVGIDGTEYLLTIETSHAIKVMALRIAKITGLPYISVIKSILLSRYIKYML